MRIVDIQAGFDGKNYFTLTYILDVVSCDFVKRNPVSASALLIPFSRLLSNSQPSRLREKSFPSFIISPSRYHPR